MLNKKQTERYEFLKKEIKRHNKLYYTNGNPEITDIEYDRLFEELIKLESNLKIIPKDSPTYNVGGEILESLEKYNHKVPLLSIPKKSRELKDLEEWYNSIGGNGVEVIVQPKCDGITVNIDYNNGNYENGATRGNGYIGENITKSINCINSFPKKINEKFELSIRGEALLDFDYFIKHLSDDYSNPRNAIAGILRQLDISKIKNKKPFIAFYDLCDLNNNFNFKNDEEALKYLIQNNFEIVPYQVVNNFNDLKIICETKMNQTIKQINGYNICDFKNKKYMCDGLVIKVNDYILRDKLGFVSNGPKWAFAHKFPSLQGEARIKEINWQVGRTGRLTPVATFWKPVKLGGAVIKNATLNNLDYIRTLEFDKPRILSVLRDVCIGDSIVATESNKTLLELNYEPYIVKNIDIEKRKLNLIQNDEEFTIKFIENYFYRIKGLHIDDMVIVERSNDVIPKIIKIKNMKCRNIIEFYNKKNKLFYGEIDNNGITYINDNIITIGEYTYNENSRKTFIDLPKVCPSCGEKIIQKDSLYFCENINCKSRLKFTLAHFVERDAMNITGIGGKTLECLLKHKLINNIYDIYQLNNYKEEMLKIDGFKDKKINNILESIEKSKKVKMENFLYSLGIDGIGLSLSKIICSQYDNFEDIMNLKYEDLIKINDIGNINALNFVNFFLNKENKTMILNLLKIIRFENSNKNTNILNNINFVITGTLENSRNYYQNIIESNGGKVSNSISKNTNVVLIGEDAGKKKEKAENLKKEGNLLLLIYNHNDFINYIKKLGGKI